MLALVFEVNASVRADVVITNENQSNVGDIWGPDKQVGVAILVAGTAINVTRVEMSQVNFGTTADETFGIYARNADGTLGSLVYSDFTMSVPSNSGIATGTANSPMVLAPNTSYWLAMNSGASGAPINVDSTRSTGFTASFGVTLPNDNHVVTIDPGDGSGSEYGPASVSPPIFQINGTAVPEPSSVALLGIASIIGLLCSRRRVRVQI